MSDKTLTDPMPRWDMTVVHPSLTSPEFAAAFATFTAGIADLTALFDRHGIAADAPVRSPAETVAAFEEALHALNSFWEESATLGTYISCHVAADSRDAVAQAKMSEYRAQSVPLSTLNTRWTAWLGTLDLDALLAPSEAARAHEHYLREAKEQAKHLMSPVEESLSAELRLSGTASWGRLHGDITSQLTVTFAPRTGAEPVTLPMSAVRALASDSNPETRRNAYAAELATWKTVEVPLAAAMNSIKHETNVLSTRRGWSSPLDRTCFDNAIDRATLDAMLSAAHKSFPDFRRYFRAKAKILSGAETLPWYDLFAPVGEPGREWTWAEAESFVAEQFGTYSEKMRDFALRSYREKWIDAAPREGKRDGAFCARLRKDESRILHNYKPAFGSVSTLAHELGHAYHNLCLSNRTPFQRGMPMTLAETASIFCETIIQQAAQKDATGGEKLSLLEESLQRSSQVVEDITSRFLFESNVLEQRQKRDLSPVELSELMLQAQRDTYGDGLDENFLHPYMWAVKGHYYGATFYNYPYMFGLLFGMGLYAQFQTEGESFKARYDDLLSQTGMADAATLGERFGLNIREEAFWTASLDIVRTEIDEFVALAG